MARERVDIRIQPELRKAVDRAAAELGEPWNRSRVIERVLEMFLAEGLGVAELRVMRGAWDIPSKDVRAFLEGRAAVECADDEAAKERRRRKKPRKSARGA